MLSVALEERGLGTPWFLPDLTNFALADCFPQVKFAVVQYGAEIRTEFDLQESCNKSSALFKVHNIMQLGSVTKTASALQHVL